MIEMNMRLPETIYVGCSGGIDSMVCLHFIERSGRRVTPVYIDHGDPVSAQEKAFLIDRRPDIIVMEADPVIPKGRSKEHVWSQRRHALLSSLDGPVVLGHTLDDCVETWVTSTLQGKPTLISQTKGNLIRPFLLTAKSEFVKYAQNNGVEWVEDPTNSDPTYAQRNFVRLELLPRAYEVNKGLRKTVRKMIRQRDGLDCPLQKNL